MPAAKAESVGMSTKGLNRIDEVMQEHIDAGHIQGAVTIVARRGKVVHFSTHGEMDVKNSRAMEPDAIYRMASSTKPVIGVAAMMMVDEGLISPSDPVSKYIPEFAATKVAVLEPAANSSQGNLRKSLKQKISKQKDFKQKNFKKEVPKHRLVPVDTPMTIHHLLTHTSGLMSGGLGSAVNPVIRTSDDTLETYVAKLAKVPLDFQPGTRWAYGNAGIHAVVPRIIELVSETPFEEFVRERVLNPLEMNNSYFSLPSGKESKRVVVTFKGREVKKKNGGTGLSSTAEDYLHFQQMLLNGGEFFGNRLLRPESVEMMSSNQVGELFTRGKKGQKGMGFGYTVAVTLDPDVVANHRGKGAFGWGGAGGTMSWTDPENELVAVIMLQQPRGSMQRDFAKAIQEAIIE
jgi:CubicO group peptidase (beta-lactamase class C family)